VLLAGLEHLDDRYLKAVGYATKSKRGGLPKMVLIGDIVGDDADAVARATSEVVRIANSRAAKASSPSAPTRARSSGSTASAPPPSPPHQRLQDQRGRGDPAAAHGRVHRRHRAHQHRAQPAQQAGAGRRAGGLLRPRQLPLGKATTPARSPAPSCWKTACSRPWRCCARCARCGSSGSTSDVVQGDSGETCSRSCRTWRLRASWKTQILKPLQRMFAGAAFEPILDECRASTSDVLRGRVWVALHMHAGDGNVHTNIPVNSDNYAMLQTAHEAVARIMALARSLGGVISGEHGIGITKLEFLTDAELRPFADYKQRVDPEGRFNKGKLLRAAARAGTATCGRRPEQCLHAQLRPDGARVADHAAERHRRHRDSIKDCLRCGKCKPVCATHVPRANLLYSPRNKILATSLLIEAFLYEEQTRRGVSLQALGRVRGRGRPLHGVPQVPVPCPVKIDFGDVTMNMRNLLRKMGKKSFRPGNAAAMFFLNATDPADHQAMRVAMVDVGFKAQRLANDLLKVGRPQADRAPPATLGTAPIKEQVIHFINKKMPGGLPKKTARALLDIEDRTTCPSSATRRPPRPTPRRCSTSPAAAQRAPVQPGRPGHAGHALACRRADRAAAGLPVLRLPAARQRPVRQGREDHHRQPGAVPPRGQHAELPGHQDRGGQLRHLLRPAAGLPVRGHLPRLPHRRHPRVPAGKGHHAAGRRPGRGYLYHDPCHSPMKLQEPMKTVKALVGPQRAEERALLRRERHAGRDPARHFHPGALPQGRRTAQGRGRAARRWGAVAAKGQRQDPDQLPELPAGPEALRGRPATACWRPTTSWSRWRARSWARLAARLRGPANAGASSGCWSYRESL
jgi:FAD/FMN-containing dehydrogenase